MKQLYKFLTLCFAVACSVNLPTYAADEVDYTTKGGIDHRLWEIYVTQYYGLPTIHEEDNLWAETRGAVKGHRQSRSPYFGKLDGLTDLYALQWTTSALVRVHYNGQFSGKSDESLYPYDNEFFEESVKMCLELIENIDKATDMTAEEKKVAVAEAKCVLASHYFDMMMCYGGLPIIASSSQSLKKERATFEETVEYIIELLKQASEELPWVSPDDFNIIDYQELPAYNEKVTAHWNKAAAMALSAKVLTFAASPLFNDAPYMGGESEAEKKNLVGYGEFQQSRWERARQACDDFFAALAENGHFCLEQTTIDTNEGYRLAYRKGYIYQTSKEVLHSTRIRSYDNWANSLYNWSNWVELGRNSYLPTAEYMQMFPWKDGRAFDWKKDSIQIHGGNNKISGKYTAGKLFYEYKDSQKNATRDPRLYEEMIVNGTSRSLKWDDATTSDDDYELWIGGYDQADMVGTLDADGNPVITQKSGSPYSTGFGVAKYQLTGYDYQRMPLQWVYLGLNEMYLMYAECLAQTDRFTEAIEQVDIIRSRVGMTISLGNAVPECQNDKNVLIEEILRERACELGMSNNRYYDMCRYKRGDWMTKKLHGLATVRLDEKNSKLIPSSRPYIGNQQSSAEKPTIFAYTLFELNNNPQGGRAAWNMEPTDKKILRSFLMPFPQTEIDAGYGLVQNPGWPDGKPDAISNVKAYSPAKNGEIYDLSGRRQNKNSLKPGLYIQNGVKFMVK